MRHTKPISALRIGDIVAIEPEGSAMIQRVRAGDDAVDVCWKYLDGPKRGHLDQAFLKAEAEVYLP